MILLYLDSSAWVKRYFQEAGSAWVNRQFTGEVCLGCSTLGLIEVTATCARKRASGAIDAILSQYVEACLVDDWTRLFQVELTPDVVERSRDFAMKYALRGADSVHLASAVILREKLEVPAVDFALVTSDGELKSAALQFGLLVIDPEDLG